MPTKVLINYIMLKPDEYGYEVRTDDEEYRQLMVCEKKQTARDYCERQGLEVVSELG